MDNNQTFKNKFSKFENSRFDLGMAMIMTLFSKENEDVVNKKIQEQLLEVKVNTNTKAGVKGVVYALDSDDMDKARIDYIQHDPNNPLYSWAVMVHEFAHFIGKPTMDQIEDELNSGSEKSNSGGVKIFNFDKGKEYANCFNECGADLVSQMAMSVNKAFRQDNPQITSVDDLIDTNKRYLETDYNPMATMTRLLTVAMDNDFGNQTYEDMVRDGRGILDRNVDFVNAQTGKVVETVPVNDFLFGMTGHGTHVEQQFDRYSRVWQL